jgi:hypothetical protein
MSDRLFEFVPSPIPPSCGDNKTSGLKVSVAAYFSGKYLLTLASPSTAPLAALKIAVHV